MNIIILTDVFPPYGVGGAATIASVHAHAMLREGYEVTVITIVKDKTHIGESVENGLRVMRLYSNYNARFRSYVSLWNPSLVGKVKNILKKEKPDIVHAHNIHHFLSYRALVHARKYSKALFLTVHDSMPFHYGKLFPD